MAKKKKMWWEDVMDHILLETIREVLNPGYMSVEVKDNLYTFVIKNDIGTGVGFSICSPTDKNDKRTGLDNSAHRAMKAILVEESSDKIRYDYDELPQNWTLKQAKNIRKVFESGITHKSCFIPNGYKDDKISCNCKCK